MKNEFNSPRALPQPSQDEIRTYAYQLYEQGNGAPGHDLDHWLEAIACLQAGIPAQRAGTRLHEHANEPESDELFAVSVGARTLMT